MGLWSSLRCLGLDPCCSQDDFQAQVVQHLIYTITYMQIHTYIISKDPSQNVIMRMALEETVLNVYTKIS